MLQSSAQNLLSFAFAQRASLGRRKRQEDHCLVWSARDGTSLNSGRTTHDLLVVLADGMGGHVSGETASRTACFGYIQAIEAAGKDSTGQLDRALDVSNQALAKAISQNPDLEGMGSTIVAAHCSADGLRWASVGDSTLMLFRDGVLRRLNADHSHGAILDEQAAAGIISPEVARSDTRRRALHSALTGHTIPLRDVEDAPIGLLDGDWLVIASDGIFTLTGDEIATAIDSHSASEPVTLAEALIEAVAAKDIPHQDNTTVVVVRVQSWSADENAAADTATPAAMAASDDSRPLSLPVFGKTTIPHGNDRGDRGKRSARMGLLVGLAIMIAAAAVFGAMLWRDGASDAGETDTGSILLTLPRAV